MSPKISFAPRWPFLALAICLLLAPAALRAQELEDKIALCTSCHGENGMPIEADYPIIWGQEFYYLYVQLKDYQAGRRANDIMEGIVADLTKDEMKALAQHFSEQPWPVGGFGVSSEINDQAEKAFGAGQCSQCHLGGFNGNSRVPRLAGQQPAYLERTMQEFKQKIRLNAPDKGALFRAYDDADIAAMAEALAAK